MWQQGRLETGVGPIYWRVWVKGSELKRKIHRLKDVWHVGDEWHLHDPSHKAWYYLIPSKMKARIAKILGITGVVNEKKSRRAKQRTKEGCGKETRFKKPIKVDKKQVKRTLRKKPIKGGVL